MAKIKYSTAPYSVLVYIAWRNFVSKKLRTLLTLTGVVIGIGAIYFLLSFGLGLQQLVTKQVIGDKSIKSIDVTTPNSRILQIDSKLIEKVQKLAHIDSVGKSFSSPGGVTYKGADVDFVTYGVDNNYAALSNLKIVAGRIIKESENNVVLINTAGAKTIGLTKPAAAVGKSIKLSVPLMVDGKSKTISYDVQIVGVIDSGAGGELFMPIGMLEAKGVKDYTQLKIMVNDTSQVALVRKQIESIGMQTASPIDTLAQINQIFKFFTIILVGFGAIGMIVAVLGMFNTMTISLLERTKEIGLMVALGGRRRDMRKLFTLEATLLSVFGALIGVGGAILNGVGLNILMNNLAKKRGVGERFNLFSTPWWLTVGMVGFMVLVGMGVVYFPARRAQKINPIDALRRE